MFHKNETSPFITIKKRQFRSHKKRHFDEIWENAESEENLDAEFCFNKPFNDYNELLYICVQYMYTFLVF